MLMTKNEVLRCLVQMDREARADGKHAVARLTRLRGRHGALLHGPGSAKLGRVHPADIEDLARDELLSIDRVNYASVASSKIRGGIEKVSEWRLQVTGKARTKYEPLDPETGARAKLLRELIESLADVPREDRFRFICIRGSGPAKILGPGEGFKYTPFDPSDIGRLAREGSLDIHKDTGKDIHFDITSKGFKDNVEYLEKSGTPTKRMEDRISRLFDSAAFDKRYPGVAEELKQAEAIFYSEDLASKHDVVGHHLRDAMTAFATSLVEEYQPPEVEEQKHKAAHRIEAVISHVIKGKGVRRLRKYALKLAATVEPTFGLLTRQDHADHQNLELNYEDSRRAIHATFYLMYEVDQLLVSIKTESEETTEVEVV